MYGRKGCGCVLYDNSVTRKRQLFHTTMAPHGNNENATEEAKDQEGTDRHPINAPRDTIRAPTSSRSLPLSTGAAAARTSASPQTSPGPDHPGAVLTTMGGWIHHPSHRYPVDAGGISKAFSPPRMAKVRCGFTCQGVICFVWRPPSTGSSQSTTATWSFLLPFVFLTTHTRCFVSLLFLSVVCTTILIPPHFFPL